MARIEPMFFPDFEELVFDLSRERAMAKSAAASTRRWTKLSRLPV